MSTYQIRSFERAMQTTNEWLDELDAAFGWDDKQRTYRCFRAVIHALRDRLPLEESTQLAAQLPMVLTGVYYDGWNPSKTPMSSIRTRDQFLEHVVDAYGAPDISAPDEMATLVFGLLEDRITAGEIEDVKSSLPEQIRTLWPEN